MLNVSQVLDVLTLEPLELPPEDLLLGAPLLLHHLCHNPPFLSRPQQLSLRLGPTLHTFRSGLIYFSFN